MVFLYGFAKNERDTISDRELRVLQVIAGSWLELDQKMLQRAIEDSELKEVTKDGT
jgi:hypothetical protein